MAKTPQQQLDILRRLASRRLLKQVAGGLLAVAVGCIAAGAVRGEWIWFLVGAFFLLPLHTAWRASPHLLNAVRALDEGHRQPGTARVSVTTCDGGAFHSATVADREGTVWSYGFHVADWSPRLGEQPAELVFIDGLAWPALILTPEGVIYPNGAPSRGEPGQGDGAEQGLSPRGSKRAALVFGALFLLVGVLAVVGGWATYLIDTGIVESGIKAQGVVVRKDYRPDNPNEYHQITYRFATREGRVFEHEVPVSEARWRALRVNDPITVHYAADRPARHFIAGGGNTSPGMALFISLLGLVFGGAGLALITQALRRR